MLPGFGLTGLTAMAVEKKLYTIEAFEQFIALPENSDRRFELIDGEIVEKMPTEEHGFIIANLLAILVTFVKKHQLGRVTVEARHRATEDQKNSRIPDASFTSRERMLPLVTQGAVPQLPDLCIEVQSPNDNPQHLRAKANYYLANGAKLVRLIYPGKRMVEALYPDGEFDIFGEDATLTGGELLPGFEMAVSALFEE
jgi:Uma2 family endonuclease